MNMSYCRFQNTLSDLRDCYRNWDEDRDADDLDDENDGREVLSEDEKDARTDLLALCRQIINECDSEHEVVHIDELIARASMMR